MNDDKVTVLHRDPLPPKYQHEHEIGAITGYAAFEDGQKVAIRTVTAGAEPLMLIVPTAMIEGLISTLRQAKQAAIQKMPSDEPGRKTIFSPKTYDIITTPDFPGVLMAFDRNQPSELIVGLDIEASRNMGQGLKIASRHVAGKPKLILPNQGLVS